MSLEDPAGRPHHLASENAALASQLTALKAENLLLRIDNGSLRRALRVRFTARWRLEDWGADHAASQVDETGFCDGGML